MFFHLKFQLLSSFKSLFKLSTRLSISLIKIDNINPFIPSAGTKKSINDVVTRESIIFIIITLACASRPFRILSIIISTYIKGIIKDNVFIYRPTCWFLYMAIPKLFPNIKKNIIKILENRKETIINLSVYILILW